MKTIILGPPGTGKTTTLLKLVDDFIQNGIRPKQIGYFSFTKKAATEAADRAAEIKQISAVRAAEIKEIKQIQRISQAREIGEIKEAAKKPLPVL